MLPRLPDDVDFWSGVFCQVTVRRVVGRRCRVGLLPWLMALLWRLFLVVVATDDGHHAVYRKNVHTGFPPSSYRQGMCMTLGLRV